MDCLCRKHSNSSAVKGAVGGVQDAGRTILSYDVIKSLDKGLG